QASPASEHLHREPAEALLAHVHRLFALRTLDRALFGELGENHIFKGLAFAQTVPRAFGVHSIDDILGGHVRRGGEAAATRRTVQLNLHVNLHALGDGSVRPCKLQAEYQRPRIPIDSPFCLPMCWRSGRSEATSYWRNVRKSANAGSLAPPAALQERPHRSRRGPSYNARDGDSVCARGNPGKESRNGHANACSCHVRNEDGRKKPHVAAKRATVAAKFDPPWPRRWRRLSNYCLCRAYLPSRPGKGSALVSRVQDGQSRLPSAFETPWQC